MFFRLWGAFIFLWLIATGAALTLFGWQHAALVALTLIVSPLTLRNVNRGNTVEAVKPDSIIAPLIAEEMSRNAVSAAETSFSVDQLKIKAANQLTAIENISHSSNNITSTLGITSESAITALNSAQEMQKISTLGMAELESAVQDMRDISIQTTTSVAQINNLDAQIDRIKNVAQVIEDIASQTNLLALNAAIEAARAGDLGRGFAVVADEVRALAERTSQSTGEVSQIVGQILTETGEVTRNIEALSSKVAKGTENIEAVATQLKNITHQSQQVEHQVSSISQGVESNQDGLHTIANSINEVKSELALTDSQLETLQKEAEHLMLMAEHSNAVLVEHYHQSVHWPFYQWASQLAKQIGQQFEQDIQAGKITRSALFDRKHERIADTNPIKYHTQFDQYCDSVLPILQEPILKQHNDIIYAIATDDKGYVPTHNNEFCQPLTGNPELDMVGNRTKRIFGDRVGQRCGSHTHIMLLQTYKRDTGEVMHDLSVPIYVNGDHWGGLRIGYKPQHISSS